MDQQTHRSPPPATLAPASPTPNRAHWTPAKQRIFLVALAETGSVSRAAASAGMNRSSAQRLRQRLAGTPFDQMWAQALRRHADQLANPFGTPPAAPAPHNARAAAERMQR